MHLCIKLSKASLIMSDDSPSSSSCGTLLRIYSTGTLLVDVAQINFSMSLDGKSLSSILYLAKRPFSQLCIHTFAGITDKLTLEIAEL